MSPFALSVRFLQTQPDRRLIELARAGHERAFEALVQRYRRALLNYCRRLSPSDASAEDVLQQALMQAWVALGNPDVEVRDARAWLHRIVHNVAISQLRRPVHDSLDVDDGGQSDGAEDEVERRLEVRAALAGLASLPELQRRVMLSTAFEGRSHDEVADALGLSHGAVRGLIYRARATLRAAAAALTPSPLGSPDTASIRLAIATRPPPRRPAPAQSSAAPLSGTRRWWPRPDPSGAGHVAVPRVALRRIRVFARFGLWGAGLPWIRWRIGLAPRPWPEWPERVRHRRRFRRPWQRLGVAA